MAGKRPVLRLQLLVHLQTLIAMAAWFASSMNAAISVSRKGMAFRLWNANTPIGLPSRLSDTASSEFRPCSTADWAKERPVVHRDIVVQIRTSLW